MDDFDRDSNASSDNEREQEDDMVMQDADADADEDMDKSDHDDGDDNDDNNEDDNEDNNDDNNDENDDDEDDHDQQQETDESQRQHQSKPATPGESSKQKWQPQIRPEVFTAKTYDIVPTMAAPMATSVNAVAITPDLRYWMTGGTDGYIRKYDGPATINGKSLLTVAQRHPFVDSVTKAGMLLSYWENSEPPAPGARQEDVVLSPVYSLAVHSEALWLLSGLESGGINLQSVRHDEGKTIARLQKHTNAVSALTLAADEKSVLSGSWDKNIFDWDLNNGEVKRTFDGSGGQLSAIEIRPMGGTPFPPEASAEVLPSDTFLSNNGFPNAGQMDYKLDSNLQDIKMETNGVAINSDPLPMGDDVNDIADVPGSPGHDSLFGGSPGGGSDLFGDNFGGDDDNEFSRAMMQDSAQDDLPITDFNDSSTAFEPDSVSTLPTTQFTESQQQNNDVPVDLSHTNTITTESSTTNLGMPDTTAPVSDQPLSMESLDTTQPSLQPEHEADAPSPSTMFVAPPLTHHDTAQTSDSTFLSASIDGPIRIWDKRVPNPIARIGNRLGVPPWCMGACWSPDGNFIYAGRRNGTVEEFSVQKARGGMVGWQPERTFKFPNGSGPVSCVRPMPNGRHLICASHDILRLFDLKADSSSSKHAPPPFLIVPGPPRAGVISSLYVDASSRFMLSAAGNRGWEGSSTEVLIGYEINVP
ncbi:WD40-repeat-containing domain protein [Xylariaceae sp. FL1019]|nr:WD40-repeat-containing domain protein [Xylariaceae sp. FL1019]